MSVIFLIEFVNKQLLLLSLSSLLLLYNVLLLLYVLVTWHVIVVICSCYIICYCCYKFLLYYVIVVIYSCYIVLLLLNILVILCCCIIVLFGFKMLPINLLIDRAQLLLYGTCLQSERILLKMCAVHKRDNDVFMNMLMLYGAEFNLHRKSVISSVWNLFQSTIDWT